MAARARNLSAVLPLAAAAAALAILYTYNAHFPIRQWLLLRVLGYWALSLYWGVGCLSLGTFLVQRIAPRQYRPLETLVLGFALGVVAFSATVLGVGVAHGLGTAFFVLAPGVFIGAGYRSLARLIARLAAAFRAHPRLGMLEIASLVLGAAGVIAIYVSILTPHNTQHDARWYHLPIAQQYASQGFIGPFREGWLLGAYPHLASHLYTWGFLMPAGIVHRIELCAHLEFVIFLVTIAALPALVRRILPGTRVPLAWVGFFLFPGFLVYDSNLSTGADHVAALFASAGMIALVATLRTLSLRHAALVGLCAGGALSTKYSAISIALPLLTFVVARALLYSRKAPQNPRPSRATAALLGAFALSWAPHWLPNLLWYGDPVYPMLHGRLKLHPWNGDADMYFHVFMEFAILKPTADLHGVFETFSAAATLGFRAYETGFHGTTPIFGFLFAATLYCLPFTRPRWQSLVAHGLGFAAALVWYWTNHRDRYLQACLPWFVVATMCVLVSMWRSRTLAPRVSAGALVVAQLACGAGAFLEPSHFMIPGAHPLPQVMSLVEAGYKGNYDSRFEPFKEWRFAAWTALGRRLPPTARVLVHEDRLWLGLDHPVVVDEMQWQAGIRYGELTTPLGVYELLLAHGITHVITGEAHGDGGDHGLTGNLIFWEFLTSYAKQITTRDGLTLWQMPSTRPPAAPMGPSLLLTCNQSQPLGLYNFSEIRQRHAITEVKDLATAPKALFDQAKYVVVEENCDSSADEENLEGFELLTKRRHLSFYRRAPDRHVDADHGEEP